MAAVFAGNQVHNGGFRADQLKVQFGGQDVAGFLVQNIQFNYTQQVSMLYEIGSANVYYVGGRAQGQATLSRVIGPAPFSALFLCLYNDVCCPQDIGFDASAGCPQNNFASKPPVYTLQDAVLTSIGVSVTSQDVVINEQLQFMYTNLDVSISCPPQKCKPLAPTPGTSRSASLGSSLAGIPGAVVAGARAVGDLVGSAVGTFVETNFPGVIR